MKNKKILLILLCTSILVLLCGKISHATEKGTVTSQDGRISWEFEKDANTKQITKLKCANVSAVSGEITVPEKITVDGVEYTVMSLSCEAFYGASLITKVTIPENIGILTDDGAWAGSTYGYDRFFYNCTSLKEVELPKMSRINTQMFYGCKSLQKVNIPEDVTEIGKEAFLGCSSLENITLPNGLKVINDSAFKNCSSLKAVNMPDSVTSIGNSSFSGCTSLSSLKLSNNLTELPKNAFRACKGLTEVTIPNSVVRIQSDSYDDGAFAYCEALQKVTIPDSVTSIGRYAFYECGKGKLGLFVKQGSYAENWAKDNNVSYNYGTGTNTDNSKDNEDNKENSKEQSKDDSNKQNSSSQDKKENKVTLTGTDKTTATKVISKTGESAIVLVTIVLIAGIAIFVSRKLMSMKDIK